MMKMSRLNLPKRMCWSHLAIFALTIIVILETSSSTSSLKNEDEIDTDLLPDKRYAMMSYGYGSRGRPRQTYRYSGNRQRVSSYRRPWEQLPDSKCYRKRCSTSSDCCRRYNVCDPHVKVCYDCWYGYNCQSSSDCCQRYPYCHPRKKICYN
ncbi:uncharacterized protein LOC125679630 [Ostrea edulis]|uniref:uncharacterized protein LOC125679630 n=1 Tax=Ostrea edulis TaxID=37623 RepID=UPI002094190E|nr:uncharacterized protein LOC125679630 [Ostrea edulis]XP_056013183.1 uncharacterized protein LOC125679630 [Ostrea edulis]XP_056013185.1 uncharacterized protein LOC125679630 [Ostrea edulis]